MPKEVRIIFPEISSPGRRPILLPIQWKPELLSSKIKWPKLEAVFLEVKNKRRYNSIAQNALVTWTETLVLGFEIQIYLTVLIPLLSLA
jgi:hypothetical protein